MFCRGLRLITVNIELGGLCHLTANQSPVPSMATPSAPICAAQERPVFPFQPLPTSSHDVLWSFDNIAEVLSEEVSADPRPERDQYEWMPIFFVGLRL